MTPELQALISSLEDAADDNMVRWTTRKSKWQGAITAAARELRTLSAELDARKAYESTPLRVGAFTRIK